MNFWSIADPNGHVIDGNAFLYDERVIIPLMSAWEGE